MKLSPRTYQHRLPAMISVSRTTIKGTDERGYFYTLGKKGIALEKIEQHWRHGGKPWKLKK